MTRLHNLIGLPAGKTLAEVLPAFAGVTNAVHVGQPANECAACRKPFNAVRKLRKSVSLFPVALCQVVPVAFQYGLCGRCFAQYQRGGADRDAVLVALDSYSDGAEATQ